MRRQVAVAMLAGLFLAAQQVMADPQPQVSFGPSPGSVEIPVLGGRCQYGYNDDILTSGWTLSSAQQLGIRCPDPCSIIKSVGFYVEFIQIPGSLDIVIHDNGVEVSRTAVNPGQGVNNFDIVDVPIAISACIMLCPTTFDGVTGEDFNSAPYGNSFFANFFNPCTCNSPFTDNNLTIWADTEACTPAKLATWGSVRLRYR